MSTIATNPTQYAVSETSEQHSFNKSLALHLLPGVFIVTLFVASVPLVMSVGYPPMLAISIGSFFGLAFQVWHLYHEGKKSNDKWSLEGIVLYQEPMPIWQYFALVPLFVIAAFLIDWMTTPLRLALLNSLPWLPEWFEMRDTSLLLGYSRSVLVVTFGFQLLINGIAAPFIEESYFRGYLMPRLSRFGRWTPVIETALFTIYHFWQPYYWITQFLPFLPIICAVWWKRNIKLGIVTHMALNLVGGLLTAALVLGQI
jgi:membrane protease YdiL (CAAX protease family)